MPRWPVEEEEEEEDRDFRRSFKEPEPFPVEVTRIMGQRIGI